MPILPTTLLASLWYQVEAEIEAELEYLSRENQA